jgi:transcriptional regulator with XRE-family HTH domain
MPVQFCTDPFAEALKKLIDGKSQRQFARKVPCDHSTISRLLSGEWKPDLVMLHRIAEAAKVPPHYFVEYRALYIAAVIERVLIEHPHLGVAAFKRLRRLDA